MGTAVAFSFSFFVSTLGPNTLQSCLWVMPVGMELWTYEFALGSTGKHWKKNPIGIKGGRLAPIWFQQMQKRGIKLKHWALSSTKMALVTLHGDFGLSSLALVWGLQERRMSRPAENLGLAGLAVSAANVRAVQGLELVSIQQNTSKYYPVVIIYCCILCYIQPYPLIITYNILKPDICSCSFQCSIKMQMRGGSILLPGGAPYVWQHCSACTHC